jgi:hypothetical protein
VCIDSVIDKLFWWCWRRRRSWRLKRLQWLKRMKAGSDEGRYKKKKLSAMVLMPLFWLVPRWLQKPDSAIEKYDTGLSESRRKWRALSLCWRLQFWYITIYVVVTVCWNSTFKSVSVPTVIEESEGCTEEPHCGSCWLQWSTSLENLTEEYGVEELRLG